MSQSLVHAREVDRKKYSIDQWYRCVRKMKRKQQDAEKIAARLNGQKNDSSYYFVAYECVYCHEFHVGRQFKKKRKAA